MLLLVQPLRSGPSSNCAIMSNPPINVLGLQGLGDNIYQRAFVKQLARKSEVWLETSWPELYADIAGLHFVVPAINGKLRTQTKNVSRAKVKWEHRPQRAMRTVRNTYVPAFQNHKSIIWGMEQSFQLQLDPVDFDLPKLPPPPVVSEKPIAFVRPATERREWLNVARNPRPEYIVQVVEQLRPTHHIAIIADVLDGAEWFVGRPPRGDSEFIRGELHAMDMLALLAASDLVIGPVGFIVPASIALKRDCFVILGGQGGHNSPERILDNRLDCSRIKFATPREFCGCTSMRHDCNKEIPNLMACFAAFLADRGVLASRTNACAGIQKSALAISPSV
jgi:hypothetical protein